jgi:hypothetical protein
MILKEAFSSLGYQGTAYDLLITYLLTVSALLIRSTLVLFDPLL